MKWAQLPVKKILTLFRRRTVFILIGVVLILTAIFTVYMTLLKEDTSEKLEPPQSVKNERDEITSSLTTYSQQLASDQISKGNYSQAIESCINGGYRISTDEKYKEALDYFEKCIRPIPESKITWLAYSFRGNIYRRLNNKSAAISDMSKAIDIYSNDSQKEEVYLKQMQDTLSELQK